MVKVGSEMWKFIADDDPGGENDMEDIEDWEELGDLWFWDDSITPIPPPHVEGYRFASNVGPGSFLDFARSVIATDKDDSIKIAKAYDCDGNPLDQSEFRAIYVKDGYVVLGTTTWTEDNKPGLDCRVEDWVATYQLFKVEDCEPEKTWDLGYTTHWPSIPKKEEEQNEHVSADV